MYAQEFFDGRILTIGMLQQFLKLSLGLVEHTTVGQRRTAAAFQESHIGLAFFLFSAFGILALALFGTLFEKTIDHKKSAEVVSVDQRIHISFAITRLVGNVERI